MIVDTHCHAWRRWPYDRAVPDPDSRGSIESLLYEMDHNGVEHAAVVCARIGGGAGGDGYANEDNNEYVLSAAKRHPDRLTAWIDIDCVWRPDHHAPGAADRLRRALEQTGARGFTHYLDSVNDGWLTSDEGREFFAAAADAGVVASIAAGPAWLADLGAIAAENPGLPILVHHMSHPARGAEREHDMAALLDLAAHSSVGVKISGFNYNSVNGWDYPYRGAIALLFARILDAFGDQRLYWGSDFPASRDDLTYRQSIEVVRTHCAFAGKHATEAILGGNAARLLDLPVS
jgi:predicted TIM-barrel fold metal-dependent hydrolase